MYFTVTYERKKFILKIMENNPYFGIKQIYSLIKKNCAIRPT